MGLEFGWRRSAIILSILMLPAFSTPGQASPSHQVKESVTLHAAISNSPLMITEIMYNPPGDDEFPDANPEFIELYNSGAIPFDLAGAKFSAGIEYAFSAGVVLPAGGHLVLAGSSVDFRNKYGFAPHDQYGGMLNNAGERITLDSSDGATLLTLRYNEKPPWPQSPNGSGFSLVLRDPDDKTADLDDGANWRASSAVGGSPGMADPPPVETPPILVNEVLAHTDGTDKDSIEIYNPTSLAVDISGWYLTDDHTDPRKFRIPDGTVLPSGKYQVFDETDFRGSFYLSELGEEAYIFATGKSGSLTGYSHGFTFGASANGVSFGRYINSTGTEQFPAQSKTSLGSVNSGPAVGHLVISEIMYHPMDGGDEFVRVTNISNTNVPLYDPAYPANTWRFNGLGNYVFPRNLILAPGSSLQIVSINPDEFRAKHLIPETIRIVGPYTGMLSNAGEKIELLQPNRVEMDGTVPYVVVETVNFSDAPPWPTAADGQGPSLQRIDLKAYGNDPANWQASDVRSIFLPIIANNTP